MFVRRLSLTNLRCRHELEVDLDEGLNILVGPNGAGKTTVLEAAALVLLGAPLRTTNVREVIARDRDHLRVEIDLVETGGGPATAAAVTAAAAYGRDGERRLTADGAALDDAGRWKELLPVRTFAPDDLRLIKGSPRRRREYLDSLAGRSYPEYPGTLRRYEEALSQRNYLLRVSRGGLRDTEFEPWETLLATTGRLVSGWRAASLSSFVGAFQRTHEELTGERAENSEAGLPDERRRPGRARIPGPARREPGSRQAAHLYSPRSPSG